MSALSSPLSMADQHSLVEQCAAQYHFAPVSTENQVDYNLVVLQTEFSTPNLHEIERCILSRITYSEEEIGFNELDEHDKAVLTTVADKDKKVEDEYKKLRNSLAAFNTEKFIEAKRNFGPTEQDYANANEIKDRISRDARERAFTRYKAGYEFGFNENFIIDKENKIHFSLIGTEPVPVTRDMICSDLKKGSKDYKWCMGEIVGSPERECRNSYGDPCGSKYEKTGVGYGFGYSLVK